MATANDTKTEAALKVFISYSRAQVDFADDLALSLAHSGHEVIIDRSTIAHGDPDFENRLEAMLVACGTVVFVLTDESAQSTTCIWETERAKELGKRTLVVTLGDLSAGVAPPPALSKINWVHCWRNPRIPGSSQARGFVQLDEALRADIGWLTKRTDYQEDALKWAASGAGPDSPHLLRGALLAEAMDWSRAAPEDERVPEEIAAFITASEAHENRLASEAVQQANAVKRTARRWGAIAAALLLSAFGAGWLALENYQDAQDLSAEAQKQSSDFLAREAAAIFEEESGDHTLSMLMALQADPAAQRNDLRRERFGAQGFASARARLEAAMVGNKVKKVSLSHKAEVRSLSFSPDGQSLISVADDGASKIWSLNDDQEVPLEVTDSLSRRDPFIVARFVQDGQKIVSGHPEGMVRLWDVASRSLLQSAGTKQFASFIAFSNDGHQVAQSTYGPENNLSLSNTQTGDVLEPKGQKYEISRGVFSPDGDRFAGAGPNNNAVNIWDTALEDVLLTLEHEEAVTALAFSSNGSWLVSGSIDGTLRIWDTSDGALLKILRGDDYSIETVAFDRTGETVLSADDDGTIHVWDAVNGELRHSVAGLPTRFSSSTFSPDGKWFANGLETGAVQVWDVLNGDAFREIESQEGQIQFAVYVPDGAHIISGYDDGTLSLTDATTGQELRRFKERDYDSAVRRIEVSPDGSKFVSGDAAGKVRLWDIATGELVGILNEHEDAVHLAAFSPDASQILSIDSDGEIQTWDATNGTRSSTLDFRDYEALSFGISPDRSMVATGGFGSSTLRLWDIQSGSEIKQFDGHGDEIETLEFSPDGSRLLSGSDDNTLRLWDIETGAALQVFEGHWGSISSAAFSPDGALIASISYDSTLRLWDSELGVQVAKLEAGESIYGSVVFSPDGNQIVGGASDGTLRIWQVPDVLFQAPSVQVTAACRSLIGIGAKLAFDKSDLAKYPVLTSEFAQEDQLRNDPENPDVVIGLKSPCEGIVDLPPY